MENGLLRLSYPLRLKPLFADVAKRFGMWKDGNQPIKRLELDEMGTLVWDMIDGKNSVRKIASGFAKKYQVLPREAEVATASFLRDLGKRGLIAFSSPKSKPN
ncbi:PqqD family protein [Maridesulfovibrio sp.]|nr:PqqD family protein [Maridesulfovibrio sp.]